MLSTVSDGEHASSSVSESKFRSFVTFVVPVSGLETGSPHESQLACQSTLWLRSRCSLHEIVACLAASRVAVYEVALMPRSLAERLQWKEPASSVG